MNEITNAVAKRQKCIREEEYDDVVSSDKDKDDTAQSDDMTDKEEYEYVMVKRTSPQPYTILGPRDSPDAYERMKKTNSGSHRCFILLGGRSNGGRGVLPPKWQYFL